ncbi:substrate-binding domain-containing protein [Leadbettera azotonutricia]|uniref:Putative lipoprotein n=1 Tax=Leadbettera azotonutricia (strain ATCC BAA-888 / DSM 13862 / ZAS-9) TaxID=545695 RepID=F5YEW8_LEAAZ|nr:substrate-binding domain-containing protein [Leadbettera azotonutricia]AEF81263.1 putative lipoprotein [Leadbettera azotonutricia ZAS-9]
MKKATAFAAVIVLLLIVLFSGCRRQASGAGQAKKDITVVFVPKVTGNAFFESANAGAQAYAQKNGFKVQYEGSSEALIDNQIAIINKAIEQKVQALCVSALDATALDEVMKKALSAGIKVTTWDSDVSGDARMIMVSQGTPDQLGRMLVEMGAKSLSSRGKNTGGPIKYLWHYSQATVMDQNSWQAAGEKYIRTAYPNWINAAPQNFYSEQNPAKAITVGEQIIKDYPDIDLIICNDSTSLPGQAQAALNLGRTAQDLTITGFASPNAMRDYCKQGIVERWGLWDCQVQGALGCYMAWYLASGKQLQVGSRVDVPDIGIVEVMSNAVLDPKAYTAPNSGVVLLPNRTEFTINNVDNFNF